MHYDFQFAFIFQHLDQLLVGALLTIRLSALSMICGLAVGIFGAIISIHGSAPARLAVTSYVELIRSTPFLVQLFIIFFGLPSIGVQVDANIAALVAMTRGQVIRHVVLTPALEKVYPALASQFTLMMLASSIVSAISAEELTATANLLDAETFRSFEIYLVVMVLYILLALLFRLAFWLIGLVVFKRRRRLGVARPRRM